MNHQNKSILVTGGAGYIGSHTVLVLLEHGYDVVVVDNLCNSSLDPLKRIEAMTKKTVDFYQSDIRDVKALLSIFENHNIDSVIHFAGLKAVGESSVKPLEYYENNLAGTLALMRAMNDSAVKRLIFSSSATVYGEDAPIPYREEYGRGKTSNPYGTSKAVIEQMLEDQCHADSGWSVAALRYFNPVGAHESGQIGEDPLGIPNNLMPFIAQVAVGRREKLSVFGGDYATKDGTCRRDYLHVMDLAEGHVKAIDALDRGGFEPYNLGTGTPLSVLEMIRAFELAANHPIAYEIVGRRAGDLPEFWADATKAKEILGWQATRNISQMMADTWRWQSNNPEGYRNN